MSTAIIAPTVTGSAVQADDKLTYWKQILPLDTITVQGQEYNFDEQYIQDCIDAFNDKAIDQTCLQLANSQNDHGHDFDPERQRAEALEMRREQAGEQPGLYAKLRFWDKQAAKAVRNNPNLGVSPRIREGFTRADGKFVKRAIIHIAATIDPRVNGMTPWRLADLSWYSDADEAVIDLSNADWSTKVAKNKGGTATADDQMTPEQLREWIDSMSDAELEALYAEFADDTDPEGGDPDDEDDPDDDADPAVPAGRQLVGAGADLSISQQRTIDLALGTAQAAQERADEALKRAAESAWSEKRTLLLRDGVPPADLDLAEPVMKRAFPMVIDLSNSGEDDIDVTSIVTKLLEGRKGTIDVDLTNGHGGFGPGDKDPDEDALKAWDTQFPRR